MSDRALSAVMRRKTVEGDFLCPNCKGGLVAVIDSRQVEEGRRRRRGCGTCGHRWSTVEVSIDYLQHLQDAVNALETCRGTLTAALRSISAVQCKGLPPADEDLPNAA